LNETENSIPLTEKYRTRGKNKKTKIEKVVISCSDLTDVDYFALTYSRSVCVVKFILGTISELTLE